MKTKNYLELSKHLKDRKPFKIKYDGEDFGPYFYNHEKERYDGKIGYLSLIDMVKAIKGNYDFIEVEIYEIKKN